MGYEEIEGLIINRKNLKEQLSTIKQNYDYQNSVYVLIADRIRNLNKEEALKAQCIDSLCQYLSAYNEIFNALSLANEIDEIDIKNVNDILDNRLDTDVLDGTEILDNIKTAEKDYETNSWYVEYWEKQLDNTPGWLIVDEGLYYGVKKRYEHKKNDALEDIEYWEERAKLFIELKDSLDSFFEKGKKFRAAARRGLGAMAEAFQPGQNKYVLKDSSWQNDLMTLYNNSVCNEDGSVNNDLVEHILQKDADAISESEYMVVATAYLKSDMEDYDSFFLMFNNNYAAVQKKADLSKINAVHFLTKVVVIDSKKIDNMCYYVDVYQSTCLSMIKNSKLSEEDKTAIRDERDGVLQKLTLARTIGEIETFCTDTSGTFWRFSTGKGTGKSKIIEMTFYEAPCPGEGFPSTNERKVTISDTYSSNHLNSNNIVRNKKLMLESYTKSDASIIGENAIDQTIDMGIEAITSNPVVGMAKGIFTDKLENEENVKTVKEVTESSKITDVAVRFNLCGNVVTYDKGGIINNGTTKIFIYEDKDTSEMIELYNSRGGFDYSVQEIIQNPIDIFDAIYNKEIESGSRIFEE